MAEIGGKPDISVLVLFCCFYRSGSDMKFEAVRCTFLFDLDLRNDFMRSSLLQVFSTMSMPS